ncbi:hypothetical protein DPMN_164504 [Dreissena polymorpha]|uniref:Uncharacterized protein n=1 Tax=Dreissena polymorpha TaxID=45954 RepID=A0A9D4IVP4_DREPO|nr:hypothetical protein DPMN_164504 [Dreissena polymorpha]
MFHYKSGHYLVIPTEKRFSVRASTLVASARRKSTRTVYEALWKLFSDWCIRGHIDPLNHSARRIDDFLIYLFDDKKLSLISIKGYRLCFSISRLFVSHHKSVLTQLF